MVLHDTRGLQDWTDPSHEVVRLVLKEVDPLISGLINEKNDFSPQFERNLVNESIDFIHIIGRLKFNGVQQLVIHLLRHTIRVIEPVEDDQLFSLFFVYLLVVRNDGSKSTRTDGKEDYTEDHE